MTTIVGGGGARFTATNQTIAGRSLAAYPGSVAATSSGDVYFGDYNSKGLLKYVAATGMVVPVTNVGTDAVTGTDGPALQATIKMDSSLTIWNGTLYIGESYVDVRYIDADGYMRNYLTGLAGKPLYSIDFDPAGNLFFNGNIWLYRVDAVTKALKAFRPLPTFVDNSYTSLAVRGRDDVVVACGAGDMIYSVNTTGAGSSTLMYPSLALRTPPDNQQLYYPTGVVYDTQGRMFISDASGDQILCVDSQGIHTIAGTGAGFNGEGPAPATTLKLQDPYRVVLGGDGSLYVMDNSNFRIRKLTQVA
jgi:streptogramin lyase